MTTAVYIHNACLRHDTGPGHPENSNRLRAIMEALSDETFVDLAHREAPMGREEDIYRVHPEAYVNKILSTIPSAGYARADADTVVSPGSREAAFRAVGAATAAVDAVAAGEVENAFCAIRPPGHHAEPSRAMGFCLFSNAAIAALRARAVHGLRRVAVVDFDVHHGNGTEAVAQGDADFFFASSHQWPLYPGTGGPDDGAGANIVNVPLDPGSDGTVFRAAWQRRILPALELFRPDILIISAGFDAHRDDPLAGLELEEADYAWVTAALCDVADTCCKGRVVSLLEGGYNLAALGRSVAAHVKVLMERTRG